MQFITDNVRKKMMVQTITYIVILLNLKDTQLCRKGFYGDVNLDHCYAFYSTPQTYYEAQSSCEQLGGRLAQLQLADAESFRSLSQWDSSIAQMVFNTIANRTRGWFDRTNRQDITECNVMIQSEVLVGLAIDCSQKYPYYCQISRTEAGKKLPSMELTYSAPIPPVSGGEGSGSLRVIKGNITCQLSRSLNQYEAIKMYKDGKEISAQNYRFSSNMTEISLDIMTTQEPVSDRMAYWSGAYQDIGFYRCSVFQRLTGAVSSVSLYADIDVDQLMTFMAEVKLKKRFHIDGANTIYTNFGIQPFESLAITNEFQGWMSRTNRRMSAGIGERMGGFNFKTNMYKISDNGKIIMFKITIIPGRTTWPTMDNIALLQNDITLALEDTMEVIPGRKKRQTTGVSTTTPFTAGSVYVINTEVCSSSYVKRLDRVLQFIPVRIGEKTVSVEICITDLGPLATGGCVRDETTGAAVIEKIKVTVNDKCYFQDITSGVNLEESEVTNDLKNLSQTEVNETTVDVVVDGLVNLTAPSNNLTAIDVIYTATTLRKVGELPSVSTQDLDGVSDIVNNVLAIPRIKLKEAQEVGSATNRIIEGFEQASSKVRLKKGNRFRRISRKAAVLVNDFVYNTDIGTDNVYVGLKLNQEDNNVTVLTNESLQVVWPNATITPDTIDTAIVVPEALVKRGNVRLVLQIYANTDLFITRLGDRRYTSNGKIAAATLLIDNVTVTNLGDYTVKTYFKPYMATKEPVCGFWNYTINDNSGGWSTEGCVLVDLQDGRYICECNHLTNFAILIDAGGQQDPIDEGNKLALSIITIIGLSLSITGLTLTVVSFILFKQMRQGRGQKTLFNLALALLASIIVFLAGIERTENYAGCIVVAALLHYFILVSFAWMLVEGVLQYLRFVKVLGTYIPNFMLKAGVPAWGIPLIPVIIVLAVDYDMYSGGDLYCWMSTTPLYFAFLLPVGLIIIINFIVFFMVLNNILRRPKGLQSNQSDRKKAMINLRASVSVVVILGLTWIFGFLSIYDARLPFQYIFTILNVFQGFFIFILFVAREKAFRDGFKKVCCSKPKGDKYVAASTNDSYSHTKSSDTKQTTFTNLGVTDSDVKKRDGF
ncbi:hypothetical protein FSP39_006407 [Pinctada imbricata]|uniref:Uncharacterized protein n=1 Tax=Pinctada imbricata TaxID=66713 RepID=A0AA89C9R5_PINIB|nr:hypothetical protein FSP39_006407 [Pinctada imbricata]